MNYYGLVDFEDGDLTTESEDFFTWGLSIDDPNDTDGDGRSDLIDDPGPLPPLEVKLSLTHTQTGFQLDIRGEIGRTFELEATESLSPAAWTTQLSGTVTSLPHTVLLPVPTTSAKFFRVKLVD